MKQTSENLILPFVSVIMPIRNEANFIERCLRAIFDQTYPSDLLEIVIADGESTDETRSIIESLKNETKIPITIVNNPKGIAPTGFNIAIEEAKGEIIVRIDGHTIVESNYIEECVDALLRTDACNVGGKMTAVSKNIVGNAISLVTSSRFGVGNARFHYSTREEYVDTVYLGAWRKETFEQYGFFNEELVRNQDDEFNYRLRSKGCKILLSPKIKSHYYNRSNFKSLWRQYFQYGYWKVRVMQMHPKQMSLRQFIPFGFVSALIVFGILSIFFGIARWILFIILGLYIMANLAATIKAVQKTKITALPYIFVSFAILHISYGFGFILGLFAFRNRWRENKNNTIAQAKF